MFQNYVSKSNRDESSAALKHPSAANELSVPDELVLSDVEIVGAVRFKRDVLINGKIEGQIFSDRLVTIGPKATVDAEIRSRNVIVEGSVNGDIYASESLELGPGAEVTGDIKASTLSMKDGAVLVGTSSVGSVPTIDQPILRRGFRREFTVV